LNNFDYAQFGSGANESALTSNGIKLADTEEFECINYKEFADKFPENDLMWSTSTSNEKSASTSCVSSSSYLVKFWVDLNYTLEENLNALYAVTNM
jgi:hypothetical protein